MTLNNPQQNALPPSPYDAYMDAQMRAIIAASEQTPAISSPHLGAPEHIKAQVSEYIAGMAPELLRLSHEIHANPEVLFEEHESMARVASFVEQHTSLPVQRGLHDLDTAMAVTSGAVSTIPGANAPAADTQGANAPAADTQAANALGANTQAKPAKVPVIAVLAEYDALPIGHACGHNVICSAGVGAFLAANHALASLGVPGEVRLLGTPAEEGGCGKERMIANGVFDDIDAAVMLHPFMADVMTHPWNGNLQAFVTFTGRSAHASAAPFQGANALDAAVAAYQGFAALRQHMLPTDRVHIVFTDGGGAGNIVPASAGLHVYIRSHEMSTLEILRDRASAIVRGAALMHGVLVEEDWDSKLPYLPSRLNTTLSQRYAVAADARGRRTLPGGVLPETISASTDMGNVSLRIPAIHPTIQTAPLGTSLHTDVFRDCAITAQADQAVLDGAYALAMTMLDYIADEQLRLDVRAEFEAGGAPLSNTAYIQPHASAKA